MKWSQELPKSPGFYWFRHSNQKIEIRIIEQTGKLLVMRWFGDYVSLKALPKDWSFEWCGPIPMPEK